MKIPNFFEYQDNFALNKNVASVLSYGRKLDYDPLVSITIPTFRRPELLKESVNSVLKQSDFGDFEIVVVDNDNERLYAAAIIQLITAMNDKRIRYYINEQNIGVFGNWNRCIELASGTWMTILSDDDLLFDDYLVTLTNEIKEDSSLNRVECRYQIFSDSNKIIATKEQRGSYALTKRFIGDKCYVSYDMYLYGCFTAPHTQLYKRDLAYKIGGFNPKFAPISDYVFNAMYLYNFPNGVFLNRYLCGYRWAVNASQNRVVKAGLYRWNIAFRNFLLIRSKSYLRTLVNYWLGYSEFDLLGRRRSFLRKVVVFFGVRVFRLFCLVAKAPIVF